MIYIIFDLEATCDTKERQNFENETIEIGAIKFNGDFKEDFFQMLIKPKFTPMTYFCEKLTGITEFQVMIANTFPDVIKMFEEWALKYNTGNVLFCSWGFYDKKQIIKDCARHHLSDKFLSENHVSLKHEFPKIYKQSKLPKRGIGLKEALKKSGLEYRGRHHRALDDAYNISRIFLQYYDEWEFINQ